MTHLRVTFFTSRKKRVTLRLQNLIHSFVSDNLVRKQNDSKTENMKKKYALQAGKKEAMALMIVFCTLINAYSQLPQAVGSPQSQISYNSKTTPLNNGQYKTEFHEKWVNYMDEKYQWQEINPNFVKTGRGFEMTRAPFEMIAPFYADEAAVFNNNNRYDVFTNQIIDDKPLEQTIQPIGVDHVAGRIETGNIGWGEVQYVVYANAYPKYHADLIYWVHQGAAPCLRKFIRFNQPLAANTDFQFRVIYSDVVETVNNGRNVSVKLKAADSKRGNGWANFYIWDSKGGWAMRQPICYDFEKPMLASGGAETINPNEYILTKHIEAAYFKKAALPVFTDAATAFSPNADPETTSVDGDVVNQTQHGTSFSAVHDASSSNYAFPSDVNGNGAMTYAHYNNGNPIRQIARAFFLFNTSALGTGVTVSSATLSLYAVSKSTSQGTNDSYAWVNVVQSSPASNTDLVVGDFSQCGAISNPTEGSTRIGITTGISSAPAISLNAYNDFPLNATGLGWVSLTGVTKLGLREGHDILNIDNFPISDNSAWNCGVQISYAETPNSDKDPVLNVVYAPAIFPPTVTSPTAASITNTSATLGATITADGGASITSRGICWGTSPAPAVNCVAEGTASMGTFTQAITGLPAGTLIYYRGYAINSAGTGYSADGTFTTLNVPTVTSPTATSITTTSATLGATVALDGGSAITGRGICWGTSPAPAVNCVAEGNTGTGIFTKAISGLPAGTVVYYRGYATNTIGTGYSADATFTTGPAPANVDWNNSNVQEIILSANRSLAFINGKSGGLYTLLVKQDAMGTRIVTFPPEIKWANGTAPTLNTNPNAAAQIRFAFDGTNYFEGGIYQY